jgi:hypothetical protein
LATNCDGFPQHLENSSVIAHNTIGNFSVIMNKKTNKDIVMLQLHTHMLVWLDNTRPELFPDPSIQESAGTLMSTFVGSKN